MTLQECEIDENKPLLKQVGACCTACWGRCRSSHVFQASDRLHKYQIELISDRSDSRHGSFR